MTTGIHARYLRAAARGSRRFMASPPSSRRIAAAAALLPRHQRGVDHVLHAFAADRADREVDVLEAEAVRRHELERETFRSELRQRELARPVAVAARALHGDELHGEFFQREVGKLLELALRHD